MQWTFDGAPVFESVTVDRLKATPIPLSSKAKTTFIPRVRYRYRPEGGEERGRVNLPRRRASRLHPAGCGSALGALHSRAERLGLCTARTSGRLRAGAGTSSAISDRVVMGATLALVGLL